MRFGSLFMGGLLVLGGIARAVGQQQFGHNFGLGRVEVVNNDPDHQLCLNNNFQEDLCLRKAIDNLRGSFPLYSTFDVPEKVKSSILYLEKYVTYTSFASKESKSFVHLALADLYWKTREYGKAEEHKRLAIQENSQLTQLGNQLGTGLLNVLDLLQQAQNGAGIGELVGLKPKAEKGSPLDLLRKAAAEIGKQGHATKTAKAYLKEAVEKDASLKDIASRVRKGELVEEDIDAAIKKQNNDQPKAKAKAFVR